MKHGEGDVERQISIQGINLSLLSILFGKEKKALTQTVRLQFPGCPENPYFSQMKWIVPYYTKVKYSSGSNSPLSNVGCNC